MQQRDIMDLLRLSLIKKNMEGHTPCTWFLFAMDVTELYGARGFFPKFNSDFICYSIWLSLFVSWLPSSVYVLDVEANNN